MNRHMREEHEKMNHGRHREKHGKKKMSAGGSMVGEKIRKTSGEGGDWGMVQSMLDGKHPTTNICTNKAGGSKSTYDSAKAVDGGRKKMAAGGVGKVRKGQYD